LVEYLVVVEQPTTLTEQKVFMRGVRVSTMMPEMITPTLLWVSTANVDVAPQKWGADVEDVKRNKISL
jgi:hypothetical protein